MGTSRRGTNASIRVYWLGGACTARVKISLVEDGPDHYLVTLDEDYALGAFVGCPSLGVPRRLTIRFSQAVTPGPFRLEYRPS